MPLPRPEYPDLDIPQTIQRFKEVVAALEGLNWFQARLNPPDELIAEYYYLDRRLSQLMDHKCLSDDQRADVLPIWQKGYGGLYEKFPERR
jgi:hypothetical protein